MIFLLAFFWTLSDLNRFDERRKLCTVIYLQFGIVSILQSANLFEKGSLLAWLLLFRGISQFITGICFRSLKGIYFPEEEIKMENEIQLPEDDPPQVELEDYPNSNETITENKSDNEVSLDKRQKNLVKSSKLFSTLWYSNAVSICMLTLCFTLFVIYVAWVSELNHISPFSGHYSDTGAHSLAYSLSFHFIFILSGYGFVALMKRIGIPMIIYSLGIVALLPSIIVASWLAFRTHNPWDTILFQSSPYSSVVQSLWSFYKAILIFFLVTSVFNLVVTIIYSKLVPLVRKYTTLL